ncbi:MAG: GNAT family N-acetyltransferase/peptidase C39 family protein [Gammaproteobacteria bacterium]|nr:GNAT family N-acetyltransferase/peptidase C39 family protein [Gammaproteobacteria bacterium]
MNKISFQLREAVGEDLQALKQLEDRCFDYDRLSRRSLRHWLTTENKAFIVAETERQLVGYVLVIYYRGTQLARMYSLAVLPEYQGQGVARQLINAAEKQASSAGRLYMRLEVSHDNLRAIKLYESIGYQRFGIFLDYYDDHKDALRFQKRIRYFSEQQLHAEIPWFKQNTSFTCGPVSLMMAMHAINKNYQPSQHEELQIWREATTIFMMAGHGGCHPFGLALAARQRGFNAEVWINQEGPLFISSVRDENKKRIVEMVHNDYCEQIQELGVVTHYTDIVQDDLTEAFKNGAIPIVLISTYQMDQKKVPHWVTVSGYDDYCLYVHDPDPTGNQQSDIDCQYLPIARSDFDGMSCFGGDRLRTAVIIRKPGTGKLRNSQRKQRGN